MGNLPDQIRADPYRVVFRNTLLSDITVGDWSEPRKRAIMEIRKVVSAAPVSEQLSELYIQIIKHRNRFENWSGEMFYKLVGLHPDYAADFELAMLLAPRLIAEGLNVDAKE